MIFVMVVNVTFEKFDTNGMYSTTSSTTTKELSISLFMCFRIFSFGQIKIIFRGDENFKKSLLQMQMFIDIVA